MAKLQAIRGMNDILPSESQYWQHFETIVKNLLCKYGYQEIRFPILEKSELFHRGVGEGTDIVEKETYDFSDRNGEAVTLRPEGTAGCVRAAIQHSILHDKIQKLWYIGPMFRYERPQKGRYRQFNQFGVEVFGIDTILAEAELLAMTWRLWQDLGFKDHVLLELNNLGSNESREQYKLALVKFLEPYYDKLDLDSQRRLSKNPLRILDSKDKTTQAIIKDAPKLEDFIDEQTKLDFEILCSHLKSLGIPFKVNPYLVRGLDYYSHTVFEWVTDALGAQGTICAGGRYNSLVEQLGGPKIPAVGFAMGIERIILLMDSLNKLPEKANVPDIYVIAVGHDAMWKGLELSEQIRSKIPILKLENNTQGTKFKSQFKKADSSGAKIAIIIGEDELSNNNYSIKYLREERPQEQIKADKLESHLIEYFASKE